MLNLADYQEVLGDLEKSISLSPNTQKFYLDPIKIYSLCGYTEIAEKYIRIAGDINPINYEFNMVAGKHYYNYKKFADAMRYFITAFESCPANKNSVIACFNCANELGNEEDNIRFGLLLKKMGII